MKTVITYEVFYFFKGIYFWRPLNFECFTLEICSTVFYTSVLQFYKKSGQKEKRRRYLKKNRRKTKQCYHNDMCKGTVFPVKLKLHGESFEYRY